MVTAPASARFALLVALPVEVDWGDVTDAILTVALDETHQWASEPLPAGATSATVPVDLTGVPAGQYEYTATLTYPDSTSTPVPQSDPRLEVGTS